MHSKHLATLASLSLLGAVFLVILVPGTQVLPSIGTGLLAVATVRLTLAAARAQAAEDAAKREPVRR